MSKRNVGRFDGTRVRARGAQLLALLLLAGSGGVALAQVPGEDPRLAGWRAQAAAFCTPSTAAQYTVDLGSDGSAQEFERSLREGTFTVAFINANPFAFKYKVDETIKEVGEPDLANWFLAKIPVPAAPTATAPSTADAKVLKTKPAGGVTTCEDLLRAAAVRAQSAGRNAATKLTLLAAAITAYDQTLRAARADFDTRLALAKGARECTDIVAYAVYATADPLPPPTLPDADAAERALEALDRTLGGLEERLNVCPSAFYEGVLGLFNARRRDYVDALDQAKEQIKTLGEAREGLRKARIEVESLRAQQTRFHWSRTYDFQRAREVSLSAFRAAPDEKDFPAKPRHTLVVEAGRQRFIVAPGMLISALDPVHFTRAQGFTQNEDGSFVVGNDGNRVLAPVIVREEKSAERLAPTLALHTYLGAIGNQKRGWFLTLGVGENWAKEGLDAELLGGLTWELVPRQGFLTLGVLNGIVEHLRPGFWQGRALPEELGEAVPVRKDREWGVALGFTWKASPAAAKPEAKP